METEIREISVDIGKLFAQDITAKLDKLDEYTLKAREIAGNGNVITLTGRGPIWLYLKIAHELHGVALKLLYDSPVTGPVLIFDHDPH